MHRRDFLRSSAAGLAGLAALGPLARRTMAAPAVPQRLGVQLYTLRTIFPGDFVGVLEVLKRIGYDEVEFAGYHDREPRAVRAVLDDVGLTAPAVHVGLEPLQQDFGGVIEAAQTIGHRYVIVPWLDPEERQSLDDYRRLAGTLNEVGERVRAAGLQLAYHNHDFEFETFGGEQPAYDLLLDETDPDLVKMEIDLFWTVAAGHDPVAYIERYPGRFPLFHVKDRTEGGEMVAVGAGAIDFARIFARAEQAGLEHAFVEHDEPEDPLASVRASYEHLERLRGS